MIQLIKNQIEKYGKKKKKSYFADHLHIENTTNFNLDNYNQRA